jgi:hypothetical protein
VTLYRILLDTGGLCFGAAALLDLFYFLGMVR